MGEKILVIDDDELVLYSLEELLEGEGFEVSTASSGKEALEKAADQRFDIFLLDLIMPGMSGFEICKALREMEEYHQTQIVMLTAKSTEDYRKKGLDVCADLFLSKPIAPHELLRVLKEAASRKQPD